MQTTKTATLKIFIYVGSLETSLVFIFYRITVEVKNKNSNIEIIHYIVKISFLNLL